MQFSWGIGLGFSGGIGSALLWWWACSSRVTLANRVHPYHPATQRWREHPALAIAATITAAVGNVLASMGSTAKSVRRRQLQMLQPADITRFRTRQAACALTAGGLTCIIILTFANVRMLTLVTLVCSATIGAALSYDWLLTRKLRQFQHKLTIQLPDATEVLALSVSAGETVAQALQRAETAIAAPLSQVFADARSNHEDGAPLADALRNTSTRLDCVALERVFLTLATAIDRGSPLTSVLHEIAHDARELQRRDLMELAGKKEIAMLFPVVFFILPLTVLFALYPGLIYVQML